MALGFPFTPPCLTGFFALSAWCAMRRLALVATTTPWGLRRAIEELGDALYPRDPGVIAEADEGAGSTIYVLSILEPWVAFRLVVAEPPAYVKRLVPAEHVLMPGEDWVGEVVEAIVPRLGCEREVWIEVKPRGYFVADNERTAAKRLAEALRLRGVHARRRSRLVLKVEDTRYGIAVALLEGRIDRISFWRERRLMG